jgi:hypothetical protein
MTQDSRGGKRNGAGRKPTGRSERKTFFLSPECVSFLDNFKNESEIVEHAIRTCLVKTSKYNHDPINGLSLGQVHIRNIVYAKLPKYEEILKKRDFQGQEDGRKELNEFWDSVREELFANYFVHTDPITAQPLDESLISRHYLKWLDEVGEKKVMDSKSLKIRLDRHFYEDESDWPGMDMSICDLAFQGGHNYDLVYFYLFALAKDGYLGYNGRGWEVDYYKQDGIIRGYGYGSSQLLAHILWGEPEIKPNRINIIDRKPDSELNSAFIYWEYFFRECQKIVIEKHKKGQTHRFFRFHLDNKNSFEEQGELAKEVRNYLEREEEKDLKFILKQAFTQDRLWWSKGRTTGQEWFSIYDVLGLIRELQALMKRPHWHIRNPIILSIVNAWNYPQRISTSLEDWYYNLAKIY